MGLFTKILLHSFAFKPNFGYNFSYNACVEQLCVFFTVNNETLSH